MSKAWQDKAVDNIEAVIKEDFKNITLIELLGLENLFFYYLRPAFTGIIIKDYVHQLLTEEIERRLR